MNRILLVLSLVLLPTAVAAQVWTLLGGEGALGQDSLGGFFPDVEEHFFDPDKTRLAPDGSVQRHYDTDGSAYDGPTDFGMFSVRPDGKVCIGVAEGAGGCGVYIRDGQMRMLLSEGRGRLPFRLELGLTD